MKLLLTTKRTKQYKIFEKTVAIRGGMCYNHYNCKRGERPALLAEILPTGKTDSEQQAARAARAGQEGL